MAIERYIAGGRLFFARLNTSTGTYGTEYEIGEVVEATIESEKEFVDAFNRDSGQSVLAQKALKKEGYTLSYKTQNINVDNLKLALGALGETVNYAVGAKLPNGKVATVAGTYTKLIAGSDPIIEGRLKFVSAPIVGKQRVTELPRAFLESSGQLGLMMEEFATLEGKGSAMKDENGHYYIEYVM